MKNIIVAFSLVFGALQAQAWLEGTTEWLQGKGYKFKDATAKKDGGPTYNFYTNEMRTRYPEVSVYFSWNPTQSSFKSTLPVIQGMATTQTYNQDNFIDGNASQTNKFKLGVRKLSSIKKYYQLDLNYFRFIVPDNYTTTARGLRLVKSSTDLYSLNFMASIDCSVSESRKLCYGYNLNYQAQPGFQFTRTHSSNNDVSITQNKDILLGLHGLYHTVLNNQFTFTGLLAYDYGLGLYQNNNFRSKGSGHWTLNTQLEIPISRRFYFNTAAEYELLTVPFSNGVDAWTTTHTNLELQMGFRWAYDSLDDISLPHFDIF